MLTPGTRGTQSFSTKATWSTRMRGICSPRPVDRPEDYRGHNLTALVGTHNLRRVVAPIIYRVDTVWLCHLQRATHAAELILVIRAATAVLISRNHHHQMCRNDVREDSMNAEEWDHMIQLQHAMHTAPTKNERSAAHQSWLSTLISHTRAKQAQLQQDHDAWIRSQDL